MSHPDYHFPPFDPFQFGNVFCGSLGPLRWRVELLPKAEPPSIRGWWWENGLCFERREEGCPEKDFPLSPEGLEELQNWLGQK